MKADINGQAKKKKQEVEQSEWDAVDNARKVSDLFWKPKTSALFLRVVNGNILQTLLSPFLFIWKVHK